MRIRCRAQAGGGDNCPVFSKREPVVRQIALEELKAWIVHEDERLLVIDKPGDVVCHPSKAGPWSSLVGAARGYTGLPTMHLVFRLDRETSGIVVLAKDAATAGRLQKAMQKRQVRKTYLAVLTGELVEPVTVDQPLGDDLASPVSIKTTVRADGKAAVSHFLPLAQAGGYTLAQVNLESGRKHQIRAHAQWLGHAVVGDKLYGPDPALYLEFVQGGWTAALAERLILPRQALHCWKIEFRLDDWSRPFSTPLPADLRDFCQQCGLPAAANSRPGPFQSPPGERPRAPLGPAGTGSRRCSAAERGARLGGRPIPATVPSRPAPGPAG